MHNASKLNRLMSFVAAFAFLVMIATVSFCLGRRMECRYWQSATILRHKEASMRLGWEIKQLAEMLEHQADAESLRKRMHEFAGVVMRELPSPDAIGWGLRYMMDHDDLSAKDYETFIAEIESNWTSWPHRSWIPPSP